MRGRLDPVILLPGLVTTVIATGSSRKVREGLVSGRLESASRVVEVVGLLPETVVGDCVCWGSIEADLALVPGLLLLRVLKALLLVILPYNRSLLLLFIGLHELEPLSVLHRGLVLDRLLMLLVV